MRKLLITSFVLSDYGNSTVVGLPSLPPRTTSATVINAAAKITHNKRKHDRVTPLLQDLHWLLCIRERIGYKISTLIFKSFLDQAPSYLPFTCANICYVFLVGAGSDQQPGAPSSNHVPDKRHWMAGLCALLCIARRSGIDPPFYYQY